MNKKRVDEYIPKAYKALAKCNIAKDGKIERNFRGQISSLGAAITMGSFKAAVAFFSDDGGSDIERSKLISAIDFILNGNHREPKIILEELLSKNNDELKKLQEEYINASIAIKLAMNLYTLTK